MNTQGKTLLFDLAATQTSDGSPSGGSEYATTVFRHLVSQRSPTQLECYYSTRMPIDNSLLELCEQHDIPVHGTSGSADIQVLIDHYGIRAFYSALPYDLHALDFSSVELTYTFHGLRQIEQPTDRYELYYSSSLRETANALVKRLLPGWWPGKYLARYRKLLFKPSKKTTIVVVSNHTKFSLLSRYPSLHPDNIRVLYSPLQAPQDPQARAEILEQLGVRSNGYFLIISAGRWIKNSYRCLMALQKLYEDHPQIDLKTVVCGAKPATARRLKHRFPDKRFRYTGYLSYSELTTLYANALSFIYPTLNEGFGYPPLESMRQSTPVACSAVTSIPEVCGDAVLYFNPYATDEIYTRILQLALDSELRETLRSKGHERYEYISERQVADLGYFASLLLES